MHKSILTVFLYIIIFVTGAAGLIYQVTWQKYLTRLMGSDSIATAIILGAFLGGLSFGYYLCGKFSTRVRNHFKAYALMEGIIGIWCLFFPDIFKTVESFSQYWSFSPPLMIMIQGIFCSAILMGIPTICMGSTIPFLTRGLSESVEEATHIHAGVYAVNTAGAFVGTLLAGFFLIPRYGLPLTVTGTAFLNLGACLFFYVLSESRETPGTARSEADTAQLTTDSRQSARYSPLTLYAIAFLSGFYVMTLENVLIRIVNFSLGSSSYSFSLIVSVFILSIAAGSYVVGRLKDIPRYMLFANQLLITLSLLLIYLSLDTWPYYAHLIRAAFPSDITAFSAYYCNVFAVLTLTLVIPVGLMGATVPITFHEIKRDLENVGKHSGILFSLNTIGNLTGSLMGGIFLYYFLNHAGVFLSAVLLAGFSTCLAGWGNLSEGKQYVLPASVMTFLIVILLIFTPFYKESHFMVGTFLQKGFLSYSQDGPDTFFKEWNRNRDLKFYKDGPTATVAVTEHPYPPGSPRAEKSLSIIVNGKSDSSTIGDSYLLRLLTHIPALLSEKRENAMVIGLGTGVTAGELTLYPDVECIDVAEISPAVVEALPYFRKFTNNLHTHPRVHIHIGDAFRILGRSSKKWDIILSEPSNPWVTGVDLLFTREFYKLANEHLTRNGILAQWIHTYFANISMLGMIVNTVRQEFPYSRMFLAAPGDMILLASKKPFSLRDIERAEELLKRNEKVRTSLGNIRLASAESMLIREIWPPSYISDMFSEFEIQTMDHPRLHYMAGKIFFTGDSVPGRYLFGSSSAPYFEDFLITKKYENWTDFPFSKATFHSLMLSLKDKYWGYDLPMSESLRLKAWIGAPDQYSLSDKEQKEFMTDLIPFIADPGQNEISEGESFRKKAEILLNHILRFRNWIVPYPLDGLKQFLRTGISRGKDASERDWCLLQFALLISEEETEREMIREILERNAERTDGRILITQAEKSRLKALIGE